MKKIILSIVWLLTAAIYSGQVEATPVDEVSQQTIEIPTKEEIVPLSSSKLEDGKPQEIKQKDNPKPSKKGWRVVGTVLLGLTIASFLVVVGILISMSGKQT